MYLLGNVLIGLVAVLHVYFLILEMFLWTTSYGRSAFGLDKNFALESKALAANQGLYNGFLAAGLAWGIFLGDAGFSIQLFFLSCVIIAGIFGALTFSRKIFFVQALPAIAALVVVLADKVTS
jgi:putative membrane protein